jgi:hypothetical protein
MIEVVFLTKGASVKKEFGFATFAKVPIEKETDYSCSPKGIISLEDAKRIAGALHRGEVIGQLDELEWREDKPSR